MNINFKQDQIMFNLVMLLVIGIVFITKTPIFLFFIPVIDAIYTYRNGAFKGTLFALLSPTVLIVIDPVSWLISVTAFGFMGNTLGYFLHAKWPHEYAIFSGYIDSIFGVIITVLGMERVFNLGDVSDAISASVKQFEISQEFIDTFSNGSGMAVSAIDIKTAAESLMPSVALVMLFFYIVIVYLMVCMILKYGFNEEINCIRLRRVKLVGNPIIGALAVVYGGLLLSFIFSDYSMSLSNNSLYIGVFILAIQGAATVAMLAHKTKLPSFMSVLITLISIAFLQVVGLSILGFGDAIFDFRRLRPKGNPRDE